MTSRAAVAAIVAVVIVAAVLLNVLLLGRAATQNDPAGRLTPRLHAPAAPSWIVRPTHGVVEDRGADD